MLETFLKYLLIVGCLFIFKRAAWNSSGPCIGAVSSIFSLFISAPSFWNMATTLILFPHLWQIFSMWWSNQSTFPAVRTLSGLKLFPATSFVTEDTAVGMDLSGVSQGVSGKTYSFLVKVAGVVDMIISPPSCLWCKYMAFDRGSQLLTFSKRSVRTAVFWQWFSLRCWSNTNYLGRLPGMGKTNLCLLDPLQTYSFCLLVAKNIPNDASS